MIIAYDDSDGWYDHAYAAPTTASFDSRPPMQLNGAGLCGTRCHRAAGGAGPERRVGQRPLRSRHAPPLRGDLALGQEELRQPHLQISQASVVRFIEDNWLKGERLGGGSFDATAGSIMDMFDFDRGS